MRRIIILGCLLLAVGVGKSQNSKSITGQVIDSITGSPITGATITSTMQKKAIQIQSNGTFTIAVNLEDTIVISHINYFDQFVPVKPNQQNFVIRLIPKSLELEEVTIYTGYQKLTPNEVNGSVVVIDNKALNQQVGTNILDRLDGVTSGLLFNIGKSNRNPQNNTNISIRGLSTINGPLDPLIVLDGFIYEGDINNINPNDVDNITVLKDAAAASIWGARAGNGVIVITTRKGKFHQKLEVSANSTIIIREKPDLFSLPQMSIRDYIEVEEFLFNQGYFDGQIDNEPYRALTPAAEIFLKRRKGTITSSDSASQINTLKNMDSRNDFTKYVYKNAITQQYSINLRGGSTNNAYTASVGYDKNKGELRDQYKKLNIQMENTYRPFKDLQISLGAYYTNSNTTSGMQGYNSSILRINGRSVPYFNLADIKGNPVSLPNRYRDVYMDTVGGGKLLDWKYYPLEDFKQSATTTNLQELYAIAAINYKVSQAINFDLKYQHQLQQSDLEHLADVQSFETRDIINSFSQLDRTTGVVKYIVPLGSIRELNKSTTQSSTLRGQINFEKRWDRHFVSAISGSEIREAKGFGGAYTTYGFNSDPLTSSSVDFVNTYPDFLTGYYYGIHGSPYFSNTTYRFVSFFGNAGYNYKNRYSLSASARKDGSNIFGANTNDKWKPLWSVGAGWKISDEGFFKSSLFTLLKIKATYGYSGNVDLSKTALPVGIYFTAPAPTYFPVTRINTINNPDLKWEQSRQINVGIDFSIIRDIISGSVDFYLKKGTDLYGQTPYDYTTWGALGEITKNVAGMVGEGFDLNLQSLNLKGSLKWSTNLLMNYNKSKVTAYYSKSSKNINSLGNGSTIIPVVGKPLYGIVAYKWGGLDKEGNPQGYLDGQLSTDYRAISNEANIKGFDGENIVFIGTGTPIHFGSLINTFTWKQISLSVNISYRFNYFFEKPSIRYTSLVGGVGQPDFNKRWQNPGDELITNIPSFQYPVVIDRDGFYGRSEINFLRADNVRLQYINLSYLFNNSGSRSLPFKDLQIYANAANLGILWRKNKEGLDPDYPNSITPVPSIALGLKCSF